MEVYEYEMIRISEFSPSIASSGSNSKNPQAKCKVVINNTIEDCTRAKLTTVKEPVSTFEGVVYPTTTPELATPIETTKDDSNYTSLYKHLATVFAYILRNNNPKLIANIIDQSGKVIIGAEDLIDAISLMLNVDRNLISISYEDPEVGCLGKVNPIKQITDIKINGYDFRLGYNKQYNMLSSMFSISLTKTILF